jgi:hypothetical protein
MQYKKHPLLAYVAVCLICCMSTMYTWAQPILKSSTDITNIQIGQPFTCELNCTLNNAILQSTTLQFPDSNAHFEIIDTGKIKLSYSNNQIAGFTQKIVLTSFDSGYWPLPTIYVDYIETSNNSIQRLYADSAFIQVNYLTTDSTDLLKDIKPIITQPTTKSYLLLLIIAAASILIAIALVFIFIKNKRKKQLTSTSPFDKAMQAVNDLEKNKLSNATEIKQFYVQLKSIFKTYLSNNFNNPNTDNSTSGLLIYLQNKKLTEADFTSIVHTLRMADAVQFAKHLPAKDESHECLATIKKTIHLIHYQNNFSN